MVICCLRLSDFGALSVVLSTRVGSRRKFVEVSCTGHGNYLELSVRVKMETRNPADGYFGSEFPAICNHCRVMAAWSRKTSNIFWEIFAFLEKRPVTVKFSKLFSGSFHRFTNRRVVFTFREIWPMGNRWNCALLSLPDKRNKISLGSAAVATAQIALKICPGQPLTMYWYLECSICHTNRFTFGGVIAECVVTANAVK